MDTNEIVKRCAICGMQADPELKRKFEGETYYFHTGLCMITFEIQLEKIIAERDRLLEESRRSLGLSKFHGKSQLNEAVIAERNHALECACKALSQIESYNDFQMESGGHNDNV